MANAQGNDRTDMMSQPRRGQSFELCNVLQICFYGKGTLYHIVN